MNGLLADWVSGARSSSAFDGCGSSQASWCGNERTVARIEAHLDGATSLSA
jgi:hypothetical protein